MSPREKSHTHLPWASTINPSSEGHGTQLPFSSKAYPGGHTQFSFSSRINPRPGGHVFTGVHSIEASPSYPVKDKVSRAFYRLVVKNILISTRIKGIVGVDFVMRF